MKRIVGVLLSIGLIVISSTLTYAANDKIYSYRDLTTKALLESMEVKEIELNEKLTKLRYNEVKEDYDDLKEKVETARVTWENAKINLVEAGKAYSAHEENGMSEQMIASMMQTNTYFYTVAEANYRNLLKQEIQMMKSLENMILTGKQADRKKEQELAKTKVALQKDYYNMLVLSEQKELLERNYNSLNKQIEIEELKAQLGMSTEVSVNSIKNQGDSFVLTLNELENNMELAVENLKTKLNIDTEEELNVEYKISHPITFVPYTLKKNIEKFKENSLELEAIRKNTEIQNEIFEKTKTIYELEDDEYAIAELELMQAELSEQKLERNMEIVAKQVYFQYKKAENQLNVQMENKKNTEKKIKQLDLQHEKGIISNLQYEMQSIQHQQSLSDYNRSLVTFLNAKADLELLIKGVMPGASR